MIDEDEDEGTEPDGGPAERRGDDTTDTAPAFATRSRAAPLFPHRRSVVPCSDSDPSPIADQPHHLPPAHSPPYPVGVMKRSVGTAASTMTNTACQTSDIGVPSSWFSPRLLLTLVLGILLLGAAGGWLVASARTASASPPKEPVELARNTNAGVPVGAVASPSKQRLDKAVGLKGRNRTLPVKDWSPSNLTASYLPLPVRVVEDHHHALTAWLERSLEGGLPRTGVTLLHIDSHSDLLFPEGSIAPHAREAWTKLEADEKNLTALWSVHSALPHSADSRPRSKARGAVTKLTEFARTFQRNSAIDSFIFSAAALGLLDHIIYIHPDIEAEHFSFDLGVSGEFGTQKMTIAFDSSLALCVVDAIRPTGADARAARRKKRRSRKEADPDAAHGGLHFLPVCRGPTVSQQDIILTVAPLSWLLDGSLTTGYAAHHLAGLPNVNLGRDWWEGPLILDIDLDYFACTDSAFSAHRGDYSFVRVAQIQDVLENILHEVCLKHDQDAFAVVDLVVLYLSGLLPIDGLRANLTPFGCGVVNRETRYADFVDGWDMAADPGEREHLGTASARLHRRSKHDNKAEGAGQARSHLRTFSPPSLSKTAAAKGRAWEQKMSHDLDTLDAIMSSLSSLERWTVAHMLKQNSPPLTGEYSGNPEHIPTDEGLKEIFRDLQRALNSSATVTKPGAVAESKLPVLKPSVVTVSRSADDGFLPSDLWPTIERGLFEVLAQSFPQASLQYAPGLGPVTPE